MFHGALLIVGAGWPGAEDGDLRPVFDESSSGAAGDVSGAHAWSPADLLICGSRAAPPSRLTRESNERCAIDEGGGGIRPGLVSTITWMRRIERHDIRGRRALRRWLEPVAARSRAVSASAIVHRVIPLRSSDRATLLCLCQCDGSPQRAISLFDSAAANLRRTNQQGSGPIRAQRCPVRRGRGEKSARSNWAREKFPSPAVRTGETALRTERVALASRP